MSKAQELLDQLLNRELSAVVFVRDYLQLEFDPPPRINVYSQCSVVSAGIRSIFGNESFANLIIGQIGKKVVEVQDISGKQLSILFDDQSIIELPYSLEGPEAIFFNGENEIWGVWP